MKQGKETRNETSLDCDFPTNALCRSGQRLSICSLLGPLGYPRLSATYLMLGAGLLMFYAVPEALAQVQGYYYTEVSTKGNFYKLITGGLGSFIMVFSGAGGVAAFFLTRRGARGQNVSLAGICMLLLAAALFAMRVMIRAGMLGHEYIEW